MMYRPSTGIYEHITPPICQPLTNTTAAFFGEEKTNGGRIGTHIGGFKMFLLLSGHSIMRNAYNGSHMRYCAMKEIRYCILGGKTRFIYLFFFVLFFYLFCFVFLFFFFN